MKNRLRLKHLLFIILSAFSPACGNKDASVSSRLNYFNLTDFIESESKRLTAQQTGVDKTVFLNGKEEKKTVQVSDWNNELNAFKEADIDKKSFLGKYEVDSTHEGNGLMVKYSANQQKFRTRELSIQFDLDRKPTRIIAIVATNNVLYSSSQQLIYEREHGYWISGSQKIRFLEPDSFYVNARFDKL